MRQIDKENIEKIDLQYFGSIELYSTLKNGRDIYFYSETKYEKSLHLNRTIINGANGLITLSIPLLGGRNRKSILKDIQIAEDVNWRRIHWRSIHDSYRSSPWFEEFGWQIEPFYRKPEKFLLDWNYKTMNWVITVLKMDVAILSDSSTSGQIISKIYKSTPAGFFENDYPVYHQVFMERSGFKPNLSILDLLFCEGQASVAYLNKLVAYKNKL